MSKTGVIITAVSLFALASCGWKDPVRIGFAGGLTGTMSELGVSGRNGAMLAVAEINEAGGLKGRTVELIPADDQNTPEAGLQAVKDLHKRDVRAVIGHMTSGGNALSFDYINKNRILMLSPTVSNAAYKQLDDYYLRIIPTNISMGENLARFAASLKENRFTIVYETTNITYTEGFYKGFESVINAHGGKILKITPFKSGRDLNYTSLADAMQYGNPDAALLIAAGHDTALVCQQLNKRNSRLKVYLAPWSMTNDLIEQGGKSVERVNICSVYDMNGTTPEYLAFKKKYSDKYKSNPSFAAAYGYDAAQVLFTAMKQAPDWSPEGIKRTILSIRIYKLLQDFISIDEFGDTSRRIFIYGVRDGAFIKLDAQ